MITKRKGNKRIVVGLSGGIDSTVSLILLKKQGWEPIGVTLKLPAWKDTSWIAESINIAKKICKKLKVPYFVVDAQKDFTKKVIGYFISEIKKNKTPNPCIVCNRDFKFKKLFEMAKKMGANYVATGHYSRLRELKTKNKKLKTPEYQLLIAKDKEKDQSYMLSGLLQKDLKRIVLPLGGLTKKEVYKIAKKQGFKFFKKIRQSQDFCFVSGKSLPAFLKESIGEKAGDIIDENERIIGRHQGSHFFTLGQRKGINLTQGPYFVFGFDKKRNIVYVTKNQKKLFKKEIILSPYHLISGKKLKKSINARVKTRYRQELAPAKIIPKNKNSLRIIFKNPVFCPTPGQFAVFYDKEKCLGNGVIA